MTPESIPPRLAVDGKGFVWRAYDEHWSMVPVNPDNGPIPEPVTYYEPTDRTSEPAEGTVETVARAIYEADTDDPWDECFFPRRWREMAQAAIHALQPSPDARKLR